MPEGELYTCIRRPVLDNPHWFSEMLNAYRMYKQGFLPNDGPLYAQPLPFVQAINIIDQAMGECGSIKAGRPKGAPEGARKPPPRGKQG